MSPMTPEQMDALRVASQKISGAQGFVPPGAAAQPQFAAPDPPSPVQQQPGAGNPASSLSPAAQENQLQQMMKPIGGGMQPPGAITQALAGADPAPSPDGSSSMSIQIGGRPKYSIGYQNGTATSMSGMGMPTLQAGGGKQLDPAAMRDFTNQHEQQFGNAPAALDKQVQDYVNRYAPPSLGVVVGSPDEQRQMQQAIASGKVRGDMAQAFHSQLLNTGIQQQDQNRLKQQSDAEYGTKGFKQQAIDLQKETVADTKSPEAKRQAFSNDLRLRNITGIDHEIQMDAYDKDAAKQTAKNAPPKPDDVNNNQPPEGDAATDLLKTLPGGKDVVKMTDTKYPNAGTTDKDKVISYLHDARTMMGDKLFNDNIGTVIGHAQSRFGAGSVASNARPGIISRGMNAVSDMLPGGKPMRGYTLGENFRQATTGPTAEDETLRQVRNWLSKKGM